MYITDALPLVDAMTASEKSTFIAFSVSILLKEGGRQLLAVPEQAAGAPTRRPVRLSTTRRATGLEYK